MIPHWSPTIFTFFHRSLVLQLMTDAILDTHFSSLFHEYYCTTFLRNFISCLRCLLLQWSIISSNLGLRSLERILRLIQAEKKSLHVSQNFFTFTFDERLCLGASSLFYSPFWLYSHTVLYSLLISTCTIDLRRSCYLHSCFYAWSQFLDKQRDAMTSEAVETFLRNPQTRQFVNISRKRKSFQEVHLSVFQLGWLTYVLKFLSFPNTKVKVVWLICTFP